MKRLLCVHCNTVQKVSLSVHIHHCIGPRLCCYSTNERIRLLPLIHRSYSHPNCPPPPPPPCVVGVALGARQARFARSCAARGCPAFDARAPAAREAKRDREVRVPVRWGSDGDPRIDSDRAPLLLGTRWRIARPPPSVSVTRRYPWPRWGDSHHSCFYISDG
jgi:hypothetical protein